MEATRRLSLTLLLVAPMMARGMTDSLAYDEAIPISAPEESVPEQEYHVDYSSAEAAEQNEGWFRRRRALDTPGEDMETAEQFIFRPVFRHHQLVDKRADLARLREGLKGPVLESPISQGTAQVKNLAATPRRTAQRRTYVNNPTQNENRHTDKQNPAGTFHATPYGAVFIRPKRFIYPLPYHKQE